MKLTGLQQREFSIALRDAFSYRRLKELLQFALNKNIENLSLADDYQAVVFDILQDAQARNWNLELLTVALDANPDSIELQAFARQFNLAPALPIGPALERIVNRSGFADVAAWAQKLGRLQQQICRIEVPLSGGLISYGTGFLVGKDLVLTNHHVMEKVINATQNQADGKAWGNAATVRCRFDYKVTTDGHTTQPGRVFNLAADWLIDSSTMSVYDHQIEPKSGQAAADELDYALLRLSETAGEKQAGNVPFAPERGWVELSDVASIQAGEPLVILQHPSCQPLKLALGSVLSVNSTQTRLTYNTNTEGGSSGSPCFNAQWQLVGIHHAGDPDFTPGYTPKYNEGIPIRVILDLLKVRGKLITQ